MKRFMSLVVLGIPLALALTGASADEPKSLVEAGAKVKKLADGMKFTEGPVWLPVEKKLVFSDIPQQQAHAMERGRGTVRVPKE